MFNYTKAEIITIPIMYALIFSICILLWFLLKNKKQEIQRIPIIVITSTLLVLEVIKQTLSIATGTWTKWAIPLHYCSALMIWFALASFSKNETLRQVGYATSFVGSLVLTILFVFDPTSVIGDACKNIFASFDTFHTFIFHFLAMSIWLLILLFKFYKPTHKNILFSLLAFLIYFVVTTICAYALDVNFVNVLYNSIPFLEQLRINCGQVFYTIIMYCIGLGMPVLILYSYKFFYDLKHKKKVSQSQPNENKQ